MHIQTHTAITSHAHISFSLSLGHMGCNFTVWRLPSWEHDSSGEEGVKGTAEADTPFRI